MSSFYRQAFTVLTSDKLARALDVEREDPKAASPLWSWVTAAPGRWRTDVERSTPDRAAAGRGRGRDASHLGMVSGIPTGVILPISASTCRYSTRESPR